MRGNGVKVLLSAMLFEIQGTLLEWIRERKGGKEYRYENCYRLLKSEDGGEGSGEFWGNLGLEVEALGPPFWGPPFNPPI